MVSHLGIPSPFCTYHRNSLHVHLSIISYLKPLINLWLTQLAFFRNFWNYIRNIFNLKYWIFNYSWRLENYYLDLGRTYIFCTNGCRAIEGNNLWTEDIKSLRCLYFSKTLSLFRTIQLWKSIVAYYLFWFNQILYTKETLYFCSLDFGRKLHVPLNIWFPSSSKCFLSSDGSKLEDTSCLTNTKSLPPMLSPTRMCVPKFSMNLIKFSPLKNINQGTAKQV